MAAPGQSDVSISLALPKGHMQENIFKLMEEAGLKVSLGSVRGYRPTIPLKHYDVKLLKPQNILGMLHVGSRDVGFAGADWVDELGVDVVEVLDTGLDPVRIVAAAPNPRILEPGAETPGGRQLIVASEYENITRKWLRSKEINATFLRAYGATESLPPEDADVIVDNTATGSTLKANGLTIVDELLQSTTRLFASKKAWENPEKRAEIERLALLLQSVIEARKRFILTFNCSEENLDELLAHLPCLRAPTVSHLRNNAGFAVQVAILRSQLPTLIPSLKERGASDIIVSDLHQLVA